MPYFSVTPPSPNPRPLFRRLVSILGRRLPELLADALAPNMCLLCGQHCPGPLALCQGCDSDLPHLTSGCRRCALPMPGTTTGECGDCLRAPPPFKRCIAACNFDYPVDSLIRDFKHRRKLAIGAVLAGLLVRKLPGAYADDEWPDVITAVPLHWRRLLQRGFNQAALLAGQVGRPLQLPVANLCRRPHYTPPQQRAGRTERRKNLRDAFRITGCVRGKHIAIVDDVVTTGNTVSELARAFKNAGARRVDVWAIARTPLVRRMLAPARQLRVTAAQGL